MTPRRYRPLLLALIVLPSLAASCPPKNLDPAARPAFYANETVKRLDELQKAAISANTTQALGDKEAILIVRFTTNSAKVIRETPNGWVPTVSASLAALRNQLPPKAQEQFGATFTAIDEILKAIKGGRP